MNPKKNFTTTIVINVVIIFLFITGIFLLRNDISEKIEKLSGLKNVLSGNAFSREEFLILEKDSEQARKYLEELNPYLVEKDQLLIFPKDIAQMGRQNNFETTASFGGEIAEQGEFIRTNISMSLVGKGEIETLVNFLKTLENSRYFVKINDAEYSKSGETATAHFSGQIFSF